MPPRRTVCCVTKLTVPETDLGQKFAANGKISSVKNIVCAKRGSAIND